MNFELVRERIPGKEIPEKTINDIKREEEESNA